MLLKLVMILYTKIIQKLLVQYTMAIKRLEARSYGSTMSTFGHCQDPNRAIWGSGPERPLEDSMVETVSITTETFTDIMPGA